MSIKENLEKIGYTMDVISETLQEIEDLMKPMTQAFNAMSDYLYQISCQPSGA